LIVSNNGINNVDDPDAVLKECARVAKPGGQMVLTLNLPETMREFYYIYADTLNALGLQEPIRRMYEHILEHRPPVSLMRRKLEAAGFRVVRAEEDTFKMRFATGTALLNHSFLRHFFIDRWKSIVDSQKLKEVFDNLEHNLNTYTARYGSIDLSIPYVCLDCRRS
jgi:SAM-dependent methyltransferase